MITLLELDTTHPYYIPEIQEIWELEKNRYQTVSTHKEGTIILAGLGFYFSVNPKIQKKLEKLCKEIQLVPQSVSNGSLIVENKFLLKNPKKFNQEQLKDVVREIQDTVLLTYKESISKMVPWDLQTIVCYPHGKDYTEVSLTCTDKRMTISGHKVPQDGCYNLNDEMIVRTGDTPTPNPTV